MKGGVNVGTVYILPVINDIIAGQNAGSTLSSPYNTLYNSINNSGLYVGVTYEFIHNYNIDLYMASNNSGDRFAAWTHDDGIISYAWKFSSNSGVIGMARTWPSTGWKEYVGRAHTESYDIYRPPDLKDNGSIAIDLFDSEEEALRALGIITTYPITYSYTNSTVSGPSEAAIGDTVTVSAVPDVGYGITDASTQILVTNNDVAVPYTWDATNQRITFTMPDPS